MSSFGRRAFLALSLFAVAAAMGAEPRRRALLVGIDDYALQQVSARERDFPNLDGAVNDVQLMRDLLLSVYRFRPEEIITLENQAATREAILGSIERDLLHGAQKGDVYLFYFSGHGSQVFNSLSEEEDRMDESIVPADTRGGAADIRDKELRRRLQPLLDRGARLTVILDSCHSGSGARGGDKARLAPPDMRDVKDGYRGPKLEDGGALVLSAAQNDDLAFETRGYDGRLQGVFSWALARAVRDAAQGEPAIDTFQRAAARMRLERPDQVPVIAGNAEARFTPLLGTRRDRDTDRVIVAVRSVRKNVVNVQGGWASGLTRGSELRPAGNAPSPVRLRVLSMDGMTACTATVTRGPAGAIRSGSLLELVAWAAPPTPPLRVWVPPDNAKAAIGQGLRGVERAPRQEDAEYVLAERRSGARLEYAWVRPSVEQRAGRQCALPLRTDWHDGRKTNDVAAILNEDLRRLLRIRMWQTLPSPPEARFNYRLGIRRSRDSSLVTDGKLLEEESYGLVLRAASGRRELSTSRYVYVFMVDTNGKSVLLFPRGPIGSVENRFPPPNTAPPEIRLGPEASFIPERPYGTDTYFLLSTDEALVDPWILEWDGVSTRRDGGGTPLERLLLLTMSGDRGAPRLIPALSRWSIERLPYTTVKAPGAANEVSR